MNPGGDNEIDSEFPQSNVGESIRRISSAQLIEVRTSTLEDRCKRSMLTLQGLPHNPVRMVQPNKKGWKIMLHVKKNMKDVTNFKILFILESRIRFLSTDSSAEERTGAPVEYVTVANMGNQKNISIQQKHGGGFKP
jgi:hypothetical protein